MGIEEEDGRHLVSRLVVKENTRSHLDLSCCAESSGSIFVFDLK